MQFHTKVMQATKHQLLLEKNPPSKNCCPGTTYYQQYFSNI